MMGAAADSLVRDALWSSITSPVSTDRFQGLGHGSTDAAPLPSTVLHRVPEVNPGVEP